MCYFNFSNDTNAHFLSINKICQFRLFVFIANQVINNTDVTTISSPFPVQEVYNYYATHNQLFETAINITRHIQKYKILILASSMLNSPIMPHKHTSITLQKNEEYFAWVVSGILTAGTNHMIPYTPHHNAMNYLFFNIEHISCHLSK